MLVRKRTAGHRAFTTRYLTRYNRSEEQSKSNPHNHILHPQTPSSFHDYITKIRTRGGSRRPGSLRHVFVSFDFSSVAHRRCFFMGVFPEARILVPFVWTWELVFPLSFFFHSFLSQKDLDAWGVEWREEHVHG